MLDTKVSNIFKTDKALVEPYLVINLSFLLVIAGILAYSAIFSAQKADHPVDCVYKQYTGKNCPTCGVSRSFSELVRGNVSEANRFNTNGIFLFLFFISQFFIRFISSIFLIKKIPPRKKILLVDLSITISSFIFVFAKILLF